MNKQLFVGAFSSILLAACGGGGSSSSAPNTSVPDQPTTTVNLKPVATIQGSSSILVQQVLKLDASQSRDPEGELITYEWSVLSHPTSATFNLSQDNIATPTFSAETVGEYVIQLVVSDGKNKSDATRFYL